MRIAIDFDNTLVDYGDLLHALAVEHGFAPADTPRTKSAIRAAVIAATPDGDDRRWQRLQADAYGTHIDRAVAFEGARAFVDAARRAGHEVVVLSHKTARSSFDPSIDLRDAARGWLARAGIDVPAHFFDDRDAKARAVADLACDWLVDDLREVLEHPAIPARTARIWFAPGGDEPTTFIRCAHWAEIEALLSATEALSVEASPPLREALGPRPRRMFSVAHGGNARIVGVEDASGERRVVKSYRRDGRDRAQRESAALAWMHSAGIDGIPTLLFSNAERELAALSFIDGERPSDAMRSADACADFVLRLAAAAATATSAPPLPSASEARLSLADHLTGIERRLAALPSDDAALSVRLDRLFAKLRSRSLEGVPDARPSERIPSPSDFGPHNALRDRYDRFWFVDFEYFGWDDPAKLMADFVHGAAHDLPREARMRFVDRLAAELPHGDGARKRFDAIEPLVAFEWVLIVLRARERDASATERAHAMLSALEART